MKIKTRRIMLSGCAWCESTDIKVERRIWEYISTIFDDDGFRLVRRKKEVL